MIFNISHKLNVYVRSKIYQIKIYIRGIEKFNINIYSVLSTYTNNEIILYIFLYYAGIYNICNNSFQRIISRFRYTYTSGYKYNI